MDLETFVAKQHEAIDQERLEGLLRALESKDCRARKKVWLRHIDPKRVRAILDRGHIHLSMPFGKETPWWSGLVLDEQDQQHQIQITYKGRNFNDPEGGYCWTCQGYCEAAVAAILQHMAQRGPLPKKDEETKLTRCPICGGSL